MDKKWIELRRATNLKSDLRQLKDRYDVNTGGCMYATDYITATCEIYMIRGIHCY